jgi:hypothetical protein
VHVVKEEAYNASAESPAYWHLNSPSTFLAYSWLLDDMLRHHNETFFYLTAANLRTCNDMTIGMVQFRLGQHEDWVYMGMTTVIVDAGGKIRKAAKGGFGASSAFEGGIVILVKRPSTGLDTCKEVSDIRIMSFKDYFGGFTHMDDAQKTLQLKRTTEAGVLVGFVMFVGGKAITMPLNELAMNITLSEVSF